MFVLLRILGLTLLPSSAMDSNHFTLFYEFEDGLAICFIELSDHLRILITRSWLESTSKKIQLQILFLRSISMISFHPITSHPGSVARSDKLFTASNTISCTSTPTISCLDTSWPYLGDSPRAQALPSCNGNPRTSSGETWIRSRSSR